MSWNVGLVNRDHSLQVEYLEGGTLAGISVDENGVYIDGVHVMIGDVGEGWRVMPIIGEKSAKQKKGPRMTLPTPEADRERRRAIIKGTRIQRRERAKIDWKQPDATEQNVQKANRRMRQIIQETPDGYGLVGGPLKVAAEHIVSDLQMWHALGGEDHRVGIVEYLYGCWGETLKAFPAWPELPGYLEYRELCRKRIT